jgi:hypothetical protein
MVSARSVSPRHSLTFNQKHAQHSGITCGGRSITDDRFTDFARLAAFNEIAGANVPVLPSSFAPTHPWTPLQSLLLRRLLSEASCPAVRSTKDRYDQHSSSSASGMEAATVPG